jgi:hypothetical protein
MHLMSLCVGGCRRLLDYYLPVYLLSIIYFAAAAAVAASAVHLVALLACNIGGTPTIMLPFISIG